jgi:pimeloyl-ACP methyl ester carboxylesterase
MSKNRIIAVVVLGLLVVGAQATALTAADPNIPACYVQDQITSVALKGNVLGDPATRPLLVYVPPSYGKELQRRYPTIYFLHGFGGNETGFVGSEKIVAELMAAGKMGEVIIVLPNASNAYGGCWFARNPLTGDYRTYLAKELVTYIDTKYRTIADPNHRAISGYSMGGYGALSLAIEYPDVFRAVAACSPVSDIDAGSDVPPTPGQREPNLVDWVVANHPQEAPYKMGGAIFDLLYAWGAAWTPNLSKPPYFVDLPVKFPEMTAIPAVYQKWVDADLIRQIQRDGAKLAKTPILVVIGRGPTTMMAEVGGHTLVAALYEKALSFTYIATPGDHVSDAPIKISKALEFLYPHIAAPVETQ